MKAGMRRCPHWHIQSAALLCKRTTIWVNITKASWFYSWEKVWVYIKSWNLGVFTYNSLDQAANWDKCSQNIVLLKGDERESSGATDVSLSLTVSPNHMERLFLYSKVRARLLCFLPVVSLVVLFFSYCIFQEWIFRCLNTSTVANSPAQS